MTSTDELLEDLKGVMKTQGKLLRKSKAFRHKLLEMDNECEHELAGCLLAMEQVVTECFISEVESDFVSFAGKEKESEILICGAEILKKLKN